MQKRREMNVRITRLPNCGHYCMFIIQVRKTYVENVKWTEQYKGNIVSKLNLTFKFGIKL